MALPWPPVALSRILELFFNQDMSFNVYDKHICRAAFLHLHSINNIRNILSQSDTEKLVHGLVAHQMH